MTYGELTRYFQFVNNLSASLEVLLDLRPRGVAFVISMAPYEGLITASLPTVGCSTYGAMNDELGPT